MLDLAKAEDWDAFIELEKECQSEILNLQLQGLDLSSAQYDELNKQMHTLIDLNQQLVQVCRQQRSEVAGKMKGFIKGKAATKAYTQ